MITDVLFKAMGELAEHCTEQGWGFPELEEEWRRCLVWAALDRAHGNQIVAAGAMGIHRNTLHRYMQDLGIKVEHYSQRRKAPQKETPNAAE